MYDIPGNRVVGMASVVGGYLNNVDFSYESSIECLDCNNESEDYMVWDDLWFIATPDILFLGNICFDCFEIRLSRPLELEDFPALPVNAQHMTSDRFNSVASEFNGEHDCESHD
jgi:hypothetical protein